MRALSLFTGYGGIDLALKNYITEVVAYVEIEEYAQRIIASRMADGSLPRAAILSDVKNIHGEIGDCDFIFGGFPCQDLSFAGLGKGLEGERSGLFYEIIRLARQIRPAFVFLENVPAIRTRGLEQVIKEFTKIGYDCRWTMLSASSVGAPHKRERWFLLAHTNRDADRGTKPRGDKKTNEIPSKYRTENSAAGEPRGASGDERGQALRRYALPDSVRSRLEGLVFEERNTGEHGTGSEWFKTEPNVGRMVNGSTFRVDRIKALGNGVVPLQVKTAFEILMGLI